MAGRGGVRGRGHGLGPRGDLHRRCMWVFAIDGGAPFDGPRVVRTRLDRRNGLRRQGRRDLERGISRAAGARCADGAGRRGGVDARLARPELAGLEELDADALDALDAREEGRYKTTVTALARPMPMTRVLTNVRRASRAGRTFAGRAWRGASDSSAFDGTSAARGARSRRSRAATTACGPWRCSRARVSAATAAARRDRRVRRVKRRHQRGPQRLGGSATDRRAPWPGR